VFSVIKNINLKKVRKSRHFVCNFSKFDGPKNLAFLRATNKVPSALLCVRRGIPGVTFSSICQRDRSPAIEQAASKLATMPITRGNENASQSATSTSVPDF